MSLVMEGVYGKQVYAKSGHPNWRKVSEKPTFKKLGKQGINQCGYYVMKYASSYDGDEFVESCRHPGSFDAVQSCYVY